MSFLSRLSIANRSVVALATVALILIGLFLVPQLKQELLPSLYFPSISVVTAYPGASPAQVEQDVTNPLEQNIQGLPGIEQVVSHSSQGLSIIQISYKFNTDLDKAQQKLSEQTTKTQSSLPANVTPQLQALRFDDVPIITLSADSTQNQQDLGANLKKVVVPELQGIPGVTTVTVTGVRQQIVSVVVDLKKLQDNGVRLDQLQSTLQANNITLPAGQVNSNGQDLAVRVGNTLASLDDLKNLVVGAKGGSSAGTGQAGGAQQGQGTSPAAAPSAAGTPTTANPAAPPTLVRLSDVATVQEDLSASTTLTRVNGKESLGISITKSSDGNTVSISDAVKQKKDDLEKKLGYGAKISVVNDQAPYIRTSIGDLIREGALGAGFAILVILIFLLSIRSTLVTAISIPLSVLIALIGIWIQGFSINVLTLSGLTIAVGRVVDDSIVVLENIYRHLRNGEPKLTATLSGVKEVATAVTASTLTTVAVFLPLAFIGGIVGEYTHPLALTVTIALLASLLVALTIIPVLAYWFLKGPKNVVPQQEIVEKPNFLEKGYTPLIRWVTTHRVITVVLAVLLLVGSFFLFPFLPSDAFGNSGSSSFSFTQTLPANTNLQQTSKEAQQIENELRTVPGVDTYVTTVGSNNRGFSTSAATNTASFTVNVKPNAHVETVQQAVQDRLKKLSNIGTISFNVQQNQSVDVSIQAADQETLRTATQQVFDEVKGLPNISDVKSDLTDAVPLIDVKVDPAKAYQHGLTAIQVGQFLQATYTGTTATHVTFDGTNRQDVTLKVATDASTAQQMQDMQLLGPLGMVRLGDIAEVNQINGPTQIVHNNASRTATITATVTGQNVGGVTANVQRRLDQLNKKLPSGASASLGTNANTGQNALSQLYLALLVAIPLVFIIMVATFRSIIQPLMLLISIPFAAVGSIVLAVLTRTAIGVSSLFGFLMLIGIVVTNAIVLIDRVNHYRAEGMSARDAVIAGGQHRVRPILMTALATIMALSPMALGFGGNDNPVVSKGLAIVVIGGLTASTFLTLLLLPTLYVLVEGAKDRRNKQPAPIPAPQKEEVALS